MKKRAKISIKGSRKEETSNPPEFLTEGNYYLKDGIYYLTYKESDLTGMEGTTTTVKTDGQSVTVIRYGTNNTQFVFEKGRQYFGHYQTQYGVFLTCVTPKKIDIDLGLNSGLIQVCYLLDFAGELSENVFEVKYEIQE